MDTFLKLASQFQEQSRQLNSAMMPLKSFAEIAQKQSQLQSQFDLSGLSSISHLAKSFSQQLKPSMAETLLRNDFTSSIKPLISANNFALNSLSTSLSAIAKENLLISQKISNYASSQLILSNNLSKIALMFDNSHLKQFNSLQIAIQGISKTYLKSIEISKSWDDIEIANNVNNKISDETQKVIETVNFTLEDLENLKISIIQQLTAMLSKTKNEKAKIFIFDLITIICFLITIYTTHQQETSKTSQEVIDEIKEELQKTNATLPNRIAFELAKLNKSRVAKTNVNLRFSTKKKCKIIGLVKQGQQITVIEIQHKFLLISYLDKDTGEPKSGFVVKKYFE